GPDRPRPRPRRRQGPADPSGAGDRGRRRRARRLVHRARSRVAHPAVRRRHQRPAGAGVAGPADLLPRVRCRAPGPGDGVLPLRRRRGRLRPGHPDQPVLRHVLRAAVGRARAAVAAVRAVLPRGEPGADHQRPALPGLRDARRRGSVRLPRPARLLAGRPRTALLRVAGAGLPALHRAGARAAVVRGVPRGHARRLGAVRQHVPRPRRPLRGLLHARREALGLGAPGRSPRDGRGTTCSGRAPRDPLAPGEPRLHHPPARSRRCRGDPVRQHRVRLLPGVHGVAAAGAVDEHLARLARHGRAAGLLARRRPAARRGQRGDRVRRRHPASPAARPVRPLGGADHRGLHGGPLPHVPRRVRPDDAHPAERPPEPRGRLPRHRRLEGRLLALRPPHVPGDHQGPRRGGRPPAGRRRSPRPSDQAAARPAPAHRPAADAGGHGLLHRRRPLPAVRRL
ncbi:MAG: FIG00821438: hypothetical protein, partial [uncultured Nocardioides sp.]